MVGKANWTSHNKRYTLPAGQARLQGLRSARSLRSHASLHPYFCNPGLATQALIRVAKTSYT